MSEAAVAKKQQDRDYLSRWLGTDMPLFRGNVFGNNPFGLMRQFSDDMNRFFGSEQPKEGFWTPAIDVKQTGDKLVVTADLPGLKKDDVKVNVTDQTLTLEGERKEEKEEKREGYYHSERRYGKFFRSIPLPAGAKIDSAVAEFKDGVLQITVQVPEMKKEDAGKSVPIK
jgi:HSP20 family protein